MRRAAGGLAIVLACARVVAADPAPSAAVAAVAAAAPDPCTGISTEGGRFAACFDPGNRLAVTAGTEGVGGGIAIRHTIDFEDEPDLVWKMEHAITSFTLGFDGGDVTGELYRGRFIRHSRDGHIVLPLGATPKKIFLPFDIGALVDVGRLRWVPGGASSLDVIDTALLFDFARTRDFRTRLAFGPAASWNVAFDRSASGDAGGGGEQLSVIGQRVAPFSALLADLHLEDHTGRTLLDLQLEGGTAWHTTGGWMPRARVEGTLERVVIAINDRPVALFAHAVYDSDTHEEIAGIGVRVVLVQRRDPRVRLDPPRVTRSDGLTETPVRSY